MTVVGRKYEEFGWTGVRYGHKIHPACYEGKARIEILEHDGVDAEFVYPPTRAVASFGGSARSSLQGDAGWPIAALVAG